MNRDRPIHFISTKYPHRPNGSCEPSGNDISAAAKLAEALSLINIPPIDHIIVSGEKAVSLRERMGSSLLREIPEAISYTVITTDVS